MPEGNIAPSPAAPPSAGLGWVAKAIALVLIGLLIWFFVCQHPHGRVRESAKRAACRNNLRQIGIALRLYAEENDDAFPAVDTLQAFALLYPNYTDNVRAVSCYSAPAHNSGADFAPGGTLQMDSTSYVYLPGRFAKLPADFVLAHDKPNNHGGSGLNVLRVDVSVSWVAQPDLPELMKTIADQEARLPELRRKWEQERAAGKLLKSRSDGTGPAAP